MNAYELLGQQMVSEVLGQEPSMRTAGISAAAELLNRGLDTRDANIAAKKAAADSKSAADRAIRADVAWAQAENMLETATASKDPQKILAAQNLVSSAERTSSAAGMGMPVDAMAQRISAANDAERVANDTSYKSPGNRSLAANARVWAKIAATVSSFAAQQPGGALALQQAGQGGSFLDFMKRKHGGVPVWGWTVGGIGLGTGLILVFRSLLKGRR